MSEPIDPNEPYQPTPAWQPVELPPSGYPAQPPYGYEQPPSGYPAQPPSGYPAQPPYGYGAGYGYPPQPQQPWPPASEPARRTPVTLIVLVCAAVLVAAGVAGYFALSRSSSSGRPAIPASFDGYARLNNSQSHQAESMMRGIASGSAEGSLLNEAAIGVYSKNTGDQPGLFVLMFSTSAMPSRAEATNFTDGVLAMVTTVSSYPAGPHGGASRCGSTQFGTVPETVCAWSDDKTTGMMVSVASLQPQALAGVENDFRDLVD